MEAATGLTAWQTMIESLKGTPLWLIAAIALSGMLLWLVPEFQTPLPEEIKAWLPLGVALLWIFVVCKIASDLGHAVLKQRSQRVEEQRARFLQLYRPLLLLFLTRHLTTSSLARPPFLLRIKNAWSELSAYRRRRVGVKHALNTLFDQPSSRSGEIEYGGVFPLAEILSITRAHQQFADSRLLNLIGAADRSRYEDYSGDPSLLTDAELALYDHIEREHDWLSRRFA